MALAGAVVAQPVNPLDAMSGNPAGLAWFTRPTLSLGYLAAYGDAEFRNAVNGSTNFRTNFGHSGELAFSYPIPGGRGSLGFSIVPEAANLADWRYLDAPGGADGLTTFGLQTHRTEFVAIRTAAGIGYQLTDQLAIGASVGLVYERIEFRAPYIFQSTPGLAGFKTLLDLDTDGWAWNGEVGLIYRVCDDLQLGLRYRTSTSLQSEGEARGNAGAQLASLGMGGLRSDFRYDGTAEISLPDLFSVGFSWQALPRLRVLGQVDYIPWSEHFDAMRIKLRNGNNADLNALVGSSAIDDSVPIGWQDRVVARAAVEYELDAHWTARLGYAWSRSPIPSSHVTPLNAAISSHTLSTGIGYHNDRCSVDVGYQFDLPNEQKVGTSVYQAGEYSNSSVDLHSHWLGVSATVSF